MWSDPAHLREQLDGTPDSLMHAGLVERTTPCREHPDGCPEIVEGRPEFKRFPSLYVTERHEIARAWHARGRSGRSLFALPILLQPATLAQAFDLLDALDRKA